MRVGPSGAIWLRHLGEVACAAWIDLIPPITVIARQKGKGGIHVKLRANHKRLFSTWY